MTIKDAILATLDAEDGGKKVKGRTLLQKKLYFISVLVNEDFGFVPHYYGPYSPNVADELGALVEASFLKEEVDVWPSGGPFGEGRRFAYTLDPGVREALQERSAYRAPYVQALGLVNGHSVSNNIQLLSVAAKVHFIVSEQGQVSSIEDIRQRASELGWKNLSQQDISCVIEYLERLGLVKRE